MLQIPDDEPQIPAILNIDYVLETDRDIREIVRLLREANSILILNTENLEQQEEEAGGEIYGALVKLARAKTIESEWVKHVNRVEDQIYCDLLLGKSSQNAATTPTTKSKAYAPKITVTELKKAVSNHPSVIEAETSLLQAVEDRRLAEAYLEALKQKLAGLPAAAGARNRLIG